MKKIIYLVTVLLFISFSFFQFPVDAQNQASSEAVLVDKVEYPGTGGHFRERLKEKVILILLSPTPSKKAEYYMNLTKKRITELKQVVEKKDLMNIEKSSKRYFTAVGNYTEYVISKKISNTETAQKILIEQLNLIKKLMPTFDDTTAEWRFLKHDADYLDIYINRLKKSVS